MEDFLKNYILLKHQQKELKLEAIAGHFQGII